MFNYNYEDENPKYMREPLIPRKLNLNQSSANIYQRDRRYYPFTNYKNLESNISTLNRPFKLSSSIQLEPKPLKISPKTQRFQNENPTVYRVSPYHYQYISRFPDINKNNNNKDYQYTNSYLNDYNYRIDKDKGDQSYNVERERRFKNYNQNVDSGFINRHLNYLERNDYFKGNNRNNNNNNINTEINSFTRINNNNININNYKSRKNDNINIKYKTPNNFSYRENRNNKYLSRSVQSENSDYTNANLSNFKGIRNNFFENNIGSRNEDRKEMIRRNNSDLNFIYNNSLNNRYTQNDRYKEQNRVKYERNDYDGNSEIKEYEEHKNYYNPGRYDYKGSRYGDYIYNYYLNSPMRGDISEDWRFPPIYYYNPNKSIRKK